MKNVKSIAIGLVLGCILATLGLSYNEQNLVLIEGDKLTVNHVERVKAGWLYRMRTDDFRRFSIISYQPLGYDRGDTLKFFGRIPQCYDYRSSLFTTRGLQ